VTTAARRLLSFAKRRINYYDGGGGDDGTITAVATTAVAAADSAAAAAARQLIGTSHFGAQKRAYVVPPVRCGVSRRGRRRSSSTEVTVQRLAWCTRV